MGGEAGRSVSGTAQAQHLAVVEALEGVVANCREAVVARDGSAGQERSASVVARTACPVVDALRGGAGGSVQAQADQHRLLWCREAVSNGRPRRQQRLLLLEPAEGGPEARPRSPATRQA